SYATYRDLGIAKATNGMVRAHVIRFIPPCRPEEVSKRHYHDIDFQMVYVLKGWIKTELDGQRAIVMRAGSAWIQPPRIEHVVRLLGRLRSARSHPARGFCDGGTRRAASAIARRLEVAANRAAKRRRESSLGGFLRRLLHALLGAVILLLADPRGFAAATAQIIEFGASDLAAAHELDRVDHRRIQRKHALHALAVGN